MALDIEQMEGMPTMITKPLALALGAASAVFAPTTTAQASPSSLSASNTSVVCTVPNHVECTITDPDGVRRVVVKDTIFGVTLFNESFSCPTQVTVAWDSAFHGDITVLDCSPRFRTP